MNESVVEGELFQVDIVCNGIQGKLLFKFNGSRVLSNKGMCDYVIVCIHSIATCITNLFL